MENDATRETHSSDDESHQLQTPRGKDEAAMGVGSVRSTDEASNDRGGKGLKLKSQRRKQCGSFVLQRKRVTVESNPSGKTSEFAGSAACQSQGVAESEISCVV